MGLTKEKNVYYLYRDLHLTHEYGVEALQPQPSAPNSDPESEGSTAALDVRGDDKGRFSLLSILVLASFYATTVYLVVKWIREQTVEMT